MEPDPKMRRRRRRRFIICQGASDQCCLYVLSIQVKLDTMYVVRTCKHCAQRFPSLPIWHFSTLRDCKVQPALRQESGVSRVAGRMVMGDGKYSDNVVLHSSEGCNRTIFSPRFYDGQWRKTIKLVRWNEYPMKGCYAVTAPIRLMSHESSYLDWTLFCEPKPMTTYKLRD